jgi:hypothetical protein
MSRLTRPDPRSDHRDALLAAWTAANTTTELGSVDLARPMILWSGAGDERIEPGRHEVATLGALIASPAPLPIALDVWCRSTGVVTPGTWAALETPEFEAREHQLSTSIKDFLRTMFLLMERCPDLFRWINAATQVVRPLVPVARVARSSHDPDVLGLIAADICQGPAQTIELIIHETAHLHVRAAQAAGDLVDPEHTTTYRSPLRVEPRPLTGLILAYHALAYICAGLEDAADAAVLDQHVARQVVAELGDSRDDARSVLERASRHLTPAGADFVARTHEVADRVHA